MNRRIFDQIRGAGGIVYPVSAFGMSRSDWKHHFGPRWQALHAANFDPNGTLTPGYGIF